MSVNKRNSEGYFDPTAYEALSKIEREAKQARAYRPLAYVCSPLSGDMERNAENTRRYCRFAVDSGCIPLERLGFPFAYDHFAEGEGPDPPFLVYRYPKADNFAADGVAYFKQDVLHIEVYTDKKDPALEERIEAALDESGIFYGKGETWIDSEKLYEVLYEMEVSA